MGKLNDRNDMEYHTRELWSGVFKKMDLLLKLMDVCKPNLSIDDPEYRWVEDRIEGWGTTDRILTKIEMRRANLYWKRYGGPHNVVRNG